MKIPPPKDSRGGIPEQDGSGAGTAREPDEENRSWPIRTCQPSCTASSRPSPTGPWTIDAHIRYDVVDHNVIPSQGDGLPGLKYWARTMREVFPDLTGEVRDTVTDGSDTMQELRQAGATIVLPQASY